jgi:metal-responsive CopG/Arc/MetJ family transcriptional regulator
MLSKVNVSIPNDVLVMLEDLVLIRKRANRSKVITKARVILDIITEALPMLLGKEKQNGTN